MNYSSEIFSIKIQKSSSINTVNSNYACRAWFEVSKLGKVSWQIEICHHLANACQGKSFP